MWSKYQKLAAVLAFLPVAALSQDIAGNWQGTLQAGRDLRVIVKIAKADSTYTATFHSIDQGGQGIKVNSVTQSGKDVHFAIDMIGGKYEGKMSADGNSIVGKWSQGGPELPLNLARTTPETEWTIPKPPPSPKPMAAEANPVFEVATIKLADPNAKGKGLVVQGRHFKTVNTSLADLINFAYGLHARQITGGPAWLSTDKYDIQANPDGEGQPNDKQWKIMMQKLIAERFKLTFHKEQKELSVYALVQSKTGSKLTKSDADPNGLPGLGFRGLGALIVRNGNMDDFAKIMQDPVLDRPVLDKTGLAGRFDFTLNWTPDQFQFAALQGVPAPPNADALPDLFTAIQQQLGLKLESTKAPVEVMVIDKAEKPSGN